MRIRRGIECAVIIQSTNLHPSGSDPIDATPDVSRQDPTSAVQVDAEHLTRNRKVAGLRCALLATQDPATPQTQSITVTLQ
jgi:hypothetical protein